jgi:hypothetical protein
MTEEYIARILQAAQRWAEDAGCDWQSMTPELKAYWCAAVAKIAGYLE